MPPLSSSSSSSSPSLQTTTATIATTTMMNDLLRSYPNTNTHINNNRSNSASNHSSYYNNNTLSAIDFKPHSQLNEIKANSIISANADYAKGKENYNSLCDHQDSTHNNNEIVNSYGNAINNKENALVCLPSSLHTALKHLYHEMSATREENEVLRRNQQEQSALIKRILERQASLEVELTQHIQKREGESFANSDVAQSVQVLTEHMTQLKQRHERTNDKLRKVENELKRDKASREELIKESRAMLAQTTRDEETRKATHDVWIQNNDKRIKELEMQMHSLQQQMGCTEQFVKDKLQKQADECTTQISQVELKMVKEMDSKLQSWTIDQSRKLSEEVDRKCNVMGQSIERISQECKAMFKRSEDATAENYERFATLTREQHKWENEMRSQVRELQHKVETYKQENETNAKEENTKHKRTCVALRTSISDLRQRCECQWNELNKEIQHKITSAINANEREREVAVHEKLIAVNAIKKENETTKADLEQFKHTIVTLEHKVDSIAAEMSHHIKLPSSQVDNIKMRQENKELHEENKGQMVETIANKQITEIAEKLNKLQQERKSVRGAIAQIHDQLDNMKTWHEESVSALQGSYSQLSHEMSDHRASITHHVSKQLVDLIAKMESTNKQVNALKEQYAHMSKEQKVQHEFYDAITSHSKKCEEREVHERAILHDMIHDIRCRLESELNEQHVMSIEAKREFVELESRLELVEEKTKDINSNALLSCDERKLLAELVQCKNTESNKINTSELEKRATNAVNGNNRNREKDQLQQKVESLLCAVHSTEERIHKMESLLQKNMSNIEIATITTTGKRSVAAMELANDINVNDMSNSQGIQEIKKHNSFVDDNTSSSLATLMKPQQSQESSANAFSVKLEEMHAQWQALIRRMAQSETHTQEIQRKQCECERKVNQTLHKYTLLSAQIERNESGLHESSHVVATLASEMTALLERLLESEEHMQGVSKHVNTEMEKIQTMLNSVSEANKADEHKEQTIATINDQLLQINSTVQELQVSLQHVQQRVEHLEIVPTKTNVNEEGIIKSSTNDKKADNINSNKQNNYDKSNNQIAAESVRNLQSNLHELQTQIFTLEQKYFNLQTEMNECNKNNINYIKSKPDEQWQADYKDVFQLVQFKMNSLEKEQNTIVKQFELLSQHHNALTTHLTELEKQLKSMTTKSIDKSNDDNENLNENKINSILEECYLVQEKIKEMEDVICPRSEVEERIQEMECALSTELVHKADTEEVISRCEELKMNLEQTLHTELSALHQELEFCTKDKISVSELQELLQAEVMHELESTSRSGSRRNSSNSPDSTSSITNKINKNLDNNNYENNECDSDNSEKKVEDAEETKSAPVDTFDVEDYENRARHEYGNHETNVVEVHIDVDDEVDHEHKEKSYNRLRYTNNNNNSTETNDKNNIYRNNESLKKLAYQEQSDVDDAWKNDWRYSAALAKQQRAKARQLHTV